MMVRWRALVLSLVAFASAAAIHGLFHWLVPKGAIVRPTIAALPWAIASLGLAAAIASAVIAIRRTPGLVVRLGLVSLHVFVVLAGAAGTLASDPAFPFGPSHVDDLELPGDRGRVYLYRGGLFCSQQLWLAAPGQWIAYEQRDAGSFDCEREGTLQWDDVQQTVRVVDETGRSLSSPPWANGLAEGLYWGPH